MPRKLLGLACGAFLFLTLVLMGAGLKRHRETATAPPIPRLTQAQATQHHPPVICTNCPRSPLPVVTIKYPIATTQVIKAWDAQRQGWTNVTIAVRWEVQSKLWDGVWADYTNFQYDGTNLNITAAEPSRVFRVVLYP